MTRPLHRQLLEGDPDALAVHEQLRPRYEFVIAVMTARRARGWTQRDLAEAVGVSQPVIARLETAEHDPRLATIVAVCRALELPISIGGRSLFGGPDAA